MRKTSKFFLIAMTALLLASNSAKADTRTKHLIAGDTNLILEAPMGKCFLDAGSLATKALYKDALYRLADTDQKQVLAIFTPCNILARSVHGASAAKIMENFGYVSWLYPSVGYRYDKSREEFLLETVKKYKNRGRGGIVKLDNAIATLVRSSIKDPDGTITDNVTLIAYTTIRNIPVEFRLKDNMANFENIEEGYESLNNLINYQIKINE